MGEVVASVVQSCMMIGTIGGLGWGKLVPVLYRGCMMIALICIIGSLG